MRTTIRSISVDEYDHKNRLRTTTLPHPTWEQFLDVFRTVQRRERRFAGITVTAEDGSYLLMDGSEGLFFVLYQGADGFQFQPLADPSQPDEEVTILCGGVDTTLPRAILFDEPTTVRVTKDFWHGRLDTSSGWEPL